MQENKRPGQKNMDLQPMGKRKPSPTGSVVKNVKQKGRRWVQAKWMVFMWEKYFSTAVLKDIPSENDQSELKLKDKDSPKWSYAKIRIMSDFTHPHLARSKGPWRDIHPKWREIKFVHKQLLAKIIVLISTERMFQDPPTGCEMICQQSSTDTMITLGSNENLKLNRA